MNISATAVKRIEEIIAQSKKQNIFLRISVNGGGCSGFQYKFDFDDKAQKDDVEIKNASKKLAVIDDISLGFVKGGEIDFVDELGGSYFRINNPNAKSSCGCGTSFSV